MFIADRSDQSNIIKCNVIDFVGHAEFYTILYY